MLLIASRNGETRTVHRSRESMPTLIRLFIVLLVLAGLAFAGMIALTIMVNPGEKDVTIKIPPRELVAPPAPIDVNNLPPPVNVAPKDSSAESSASGAPASGEPVSSAAVSSAAVSEPSIDTNDSEASESGVKTVDTGAE